MAVTPEGQKTLRAVIKSVEGHCGAGHKAGEELKISCWDCAGLCGFFFHDIFHYLSVYQFGGEIPWAQDGVLTLSCPDRSIVTLELSRG